MRDGERRGGEGNDWSKREREVGGAVCALIVRGMAYPLASQSALLERKYRQDEVFVSLVLFWFRELRTNVKINSFYRLFIQFYVII